jgi:putative transposase
LLDACFQNKLAPRTKRGSITLETVFCIEAVEEALARHGKGAWRVNVFIERLWRTIKYEEVYLHGYANLPDARASIGRYIGFDNGRRPHSSLDGKTPDQAYFNPLTPVSVAA